MKRQHIFTGYEKSSKIKRSKEKNGDMLDRRGQG